LKQLFSNWDSPIDVFICKPFYNYLQQLQINCRRFLQQATDILKCQEKLLPGLIKCKICKTKLISFRD